MHTAASLAISTGADIKAVQRMLDHKNASMTSDRYGHLYTETNRMTTVHTMRHAVGHQCVAPI